MLVVSLERPDVSAGSHLVESTMNLYASRNLKFSQTKVPGPSNTSMDEDTIDSVGRDLENSLQMNDQETENLKESVEIKQKLVALNSKLSSYMTAMKKTENRLAESVQKCRLLEEANSSLGGNFRKQLEFLRSELDEQIQKTVLAEEERVRSQQQLELFLKRLEQMTSERDAHRKIADELEKALEIERRRSEEDRADLASLREQMLREKAVSDDLKKQMTDLKVDHAKLQQRFKMNSLELTFSQSKLGELENQAQVTAAELQKELAKLKLKLAKRHAERMAEELREKQIEIEFLDKRHRDNLKELEQKSVSAGDFELLKTQLQEQQRRADSVEAEAANWRNKYRETESKLERLESEHAKELDKERCRRRELNRRLLAQSRAQDEVRQELETYRKLIESLDQGGSSFTECLSLLGTLSPGSPLRRSPLLQRAPDSPEARTRLLRKVLTPRKRSLSSEGDTPSLIQMLNTGRHHET